MRPVLILGDEPRIVIVIARSLHARGVPVDIAALSTGAMPIRSRAVRRWRALPDPEIDRPLCLATLLDHLEAGGYDLVIPASDRALSLLMAPQVNGAMNGVMRACPVPQTVAQVLDKLRTLQTAAACGVPVPRSYALATLSDLEQHAHAMAFPVIAKPSGKHQGASFKVRRFETLRALRSAFQADGRFGTAHLIQEFCPGHGVGIEALMHQGRPLVLFQHRRVKEFPAAGGVSVVAVSDRLDETLAGYAVRLLQALQWTGVAMVEFRVDEKAGRAVLMEVNGRYWGSLALSVQAGVDFPWYEWQLVHGQTPNVPSGYRVGVRSRWTAGCINRIHARWCGTDQERGVWPVRECVAVAKDVLWHSGDMLWSATDRRPAVDELRRTVLSLGRTELTRWIVRCIPEFLITVRRRSRVLGASARRVYLRNAVLRRLGVADRLPDQWNKLRTVVFVCHGNIIRSPMAAALFKQAMERVGRPIEIESAGLHAHPCAQPDPRALTVAGEFGVSLQGHRAAAMTPDLVRWADCIVVMDYFNEAEVLARYPHARDKVVLLGGCREDGGAEGMEIVDPYRGDLEDVRRCYASIQERIAELVRRVMVSGETLGAPSGPYERRALSNRTVV